MKRTFSILLVILLFPLMLLSQGTSSGLIQLRLPYAARPAALGEAVVGGSGEFTSILINPSAIHSSATSEIIFSHAEWIQDVRTEFLSASIPFDGFTFAFHVLQTGIPGIEVREQPGPPIGTFTAQSAALGATGATSFEELVSIGVTVKYLYEKIYIDESTGYAFDFGGIIHTPIEGVSAGISLTNVGSMTAFRSRKDDLPSQLRIGIAFVEEFDSFQFLLYPSILHNFTITTNHLQTGAEIIYDQMVALRLGYQTGFDARGISAGFGFTYDMFTVDYAFVPFGVGLGSAHLASLGLSF